MISNGRPIQHLQGRLGSSLGILHCMRAPVGGLFRHVRDLAQAQAAAGHRVGVICDSVSGDRLTEDRLAELEQHLALGLHRFPMAREIGWQDRLSYLAIRGLVEEIRPEIIHGHGAKGGAFGRLAAANLESKRASVATFYTPHGGSLHYAPGTLKGRVFTALERRLLDATDGLIFESRYAARTFAAHVDPDRCERRIIYNGLHDNEFETIVPGSDAADFLFVGELSPIKGVDVLLDALRVVKIERPVSALIVGDGKAGLELERRCNELGLSRSVTFVRAMPLRDALTRGKCVVMASRAESLPYVALETTAAGVPLIATDVGGLPEIVTGSGTPLVAPGDAQALAAVMMLVLENPAAAVNRALLLRSAVRSKFRVSAMAGEIEAFYKEKLALRLAA